MARIKSEAISAPASPRDQHGAPMAGRKQSPNHERNVRRFAETRAERLAESRIRLAEQREAQREELERQRQERRLLLAAPIPYPKTNTNSKYTDEIAREICGRMVLGQTIKEICDEDHMPHYLTVMTWLREKDDFRASYLAAAELSAHYDADQISSLKRALIAGDIESDVARVAIQASTWLAGVRNHKLYGSKAVAGQGQNIDVPPVLNVTFQRLETK